MSQLRDVILLDNQSSVDLFCNPLFVSGIRRSQDTLTLHTNAGSKLTSHVADLLRYGMVWYNPDAITGLPGLLNLSGSIIGHIAFHHFDKHGKDGLLLTGHESG